MIRKLPLTALLMLISMSAFSHRVVVYGGHVKMRGELVSSACAVTQESQDLRVEMGQYRSDNFTRVGSFSTVTVPFTLRLNECRKDVARLVGISFQGEISPQDSNVFSVTERGSGTSGESGLGLAIFDPKQQLVIPNTLPNYYFPISDGEMALHFSARYRVISLPLMPGDLSTYVIFTLIYP